MFLTAGLVVHIRNERLDTHRIRCHTVFTIFRFELQIVLNSCLCMLRLDRGDYFNNYYLIIISQIGFSSVSIIIGNI